MSEPTAPFLAAAPDSIPSENRMPSGATTVSASPAARTAALATEQDFAPAESHSGFRRLRHGTLTPGRRGTQGPAILRRPHQAERNDRRGGASDRPSATLKAHCAICAITAHAPTPPDGHARAVKQGERVHNLLLCNARHRALRGKNGPHASSCNLETSFFSLTTIDTRRYPSRDSNPVWNPRSRKAQDANGNST